MTKKLPKVTLYSDWWAAPNPGKAGYGIILCYKDVRKEFNQWYTLSTNNRMEMMWVITGLSKLKTKSQVDVYTDSSYTINGIEKWWAAKWKENNWMRTSSQKAVNYDLWETLLKLTEKHLVTFHWVKWHNGHIENERCDELATIALEGDDLIEDEGYEIHPISESSSLSSNKISEPTKKIINKKNTNKISAHWDICWKCWTSVEKKIPKKKKLKPNQTFYYEYFFTCPWCKTNYMVPEWKREVKK